MEPIGRPWRALSFLRGRRLLTGRAQAAPQDVRLEAAHDNAAPRLPVRSAGASRPVAGSDRGGRMGARSEHRGRVDGR